ncbi:D-alanine--D-alanine ligase [Melioribacteraceae bacterium 4301-Me]|uniref:D-alanine--D-alanine ligase n=1 Tax=Pyranulibacter aquaticus TaxID=3163344 RepID=UPI003597DC0D
MNNNSKINVALLLGGISSERDVSISTGESVYYALNRLGYNVTVIDPAYGKNQPKEIVNFFNHQDYTEKSVRNYLEAINSPIFDNIDVAFIALHGKWGEDGKIQSLLELRNVKYTGSKVLPSALAMDKCLSKIMFSHYDVSTPKWFLVRENDNDFQLIKEKIKKFFGYPCVVKPNDEGSTVGLSICRGDIEVEKAVEKARSFSEKVLIEEYIEGRELTVGVLNQQVLPVLEIKPKGGFYDYEHKYTAGMSDYIVPAEIPLKVSEHLQQQALRAFNSLGCQSYARIDFRLTKDNQPYCLEVNTLPGMTNTSLVPKMAKAVGITFDELVDRIVKDALK